MATLLLEESHKLINADNIDTFEDLNWSGKMRSYGMDIACVFELRITLQDGKYILPQLCWGDHEVESGFVVWNYLGKAMMDLRDEWIRNWKRGPIK